MLEVLQDLRHSYREFFDQGDKRIKHLPFMDTPFYNTLIILCYIYFVKVAGPQFMKKRKPYDLRNVMAIYNFALVFLNLFLFLAIGWYGYFNGYTLKCQPVDFSDKHEAVMMAYVGYCYFLSKYVEFADTIFFVLRKKDSQITPLHLIHHSIVPFSLWFGMKFAPGGYNAFFPFLNTFVHVIMYTYYGVSALGDKYRKYLFWKKYMTYMQLSQFVLVILYAISMWYNQCDIPTTFIIMNFIHALLFLVLFLHFFINSYCRTSASKRKQSLASPEDKSQIVLVTKTKAENSESHTKQLVYELEKENGTHLAKLHYCAEDTCCNINCSSSRCQKRNGKVRNFCIPQTLNGCTRTNGFSVSESLKNKKVFKGL